MTTPGEITPGDERTTVGATAAGPATAGRATDEKPAPARAASPAAGGADNAGEGDPAPHDSTWIYDQLGLSPQEYKGDPAPDAAGLPSSAEMARGALLDLDLDALRPDDPSDSPFPPGSLGGGVIDPPARKFEGFPAPGTGLPAQPAGSKQPPSAAPTATVTSAPTPAGAPAEELPKAPVKGAKRDRPQQPRVATEPDAENNPFRIYDERQATGDIALPTHSAQAAEPARPAPAAEPAREAPRVALPPVRLSADSLTAENVLKSRRKPAGRGWRKGLMATTGINLGPGAKELRNAGFEARVRTEIPGCHRLAVISLKGGVGKTTTAATMGSMFASIRGDRVIAVDANPDRGTLGDKIVAGLATSTVRDFVSRSASLDRYSAVREFTAQAESRLEVLVSESDPLASMAFSENDYRIISEILERFYNLILTDCGTGLLHSAMVGVLAKADQVIIVSSASLDGARSASATLDWLEAHNYGGLARESVTVVTSVRPQASTVHLDEIVSHFAKRTRAVVAVPYDPHLAEGGEIDLTRLSKGAYQAYLELAAEIADAFPRISGAR